jgi:hypothetical protein
MRFNRALNQSVLVITSLSVLLVLGGCTKHENLPTALALETAPPPDNFEVIALGVNTSGTFDYDLTWTVSDATNVDRFRLYLVGGGFLPELVYETNAQETSDLTISLTLPSNAEGLQFGLSTVSTGSVETSMVVATIPPAP